MEKFLSIIISTLLLKSLAHAASLPEKRQTTTASGAGETVADADTLSLAAAESGFGDSPAAVFLGSHADAVGIGFQGTPGYTIGGYADTVIEQNGHANGDLYAFAEATQVGDAYAAGQSESAKLPRKRKKGQQEFYEAQGAQYSSSFQKIEGTGTGPSSSASFSTYNLATSNGAGTYAGANPVAYAAIGEALGDVIGYVTGTTALLDAQNSNEESGTGDGEILILI